MPQRLKKPCNYPGCSELVEAGKTYCEEHREDKQSRKKERDRQYNEKRDPKLRKFYSSARWKKVRKRYISKNPLCEHCLERDRVKPADVVDHIIPVKVDWSKRLDASNLQSLCNSCHAKKTQEDKKEYDL